MTGLAALGNGNYGVVIFNGNGHRIASNVVSANFVGVGMNAGPAVVIQGNLVGTDAAGARRDSERRSPASGHSTAATARRSAAPPARRERRASSRAT